MSRVQIVWLALLASMTAVGGLLLILDRQPMPRLDGLALPALASTSAPNAVESVFQTRQPLDSGRWRGIMIHHTGAPSGSPASIARTHEAMGFKGLGHHFLIGNGAGMGDGELYVGYRWLNQLPGAHAGGPLGEQHNLHSISICLVGDGDRRAFTPAQSRRLVQLVSALNRELGLPPELTVLHSDVAPTTDPGRLFPVEWFRSEVAARR